MTPLPKLISTGLAFLMLVDLFGAKIVSAQLILPATDGVGTRVTSPIDNSTQFNISGGTQAGANLYQSFQRFGLNQGQTATFLSNPTIANILGRVTGGDASVINGLIQVTGGNSNLFLMNPAGIVFGQGASLNVPGSFAATTANGIAIGSHWFNATGSNDFANLGGTPNGFGFLSNPGAILNAGNLAVTPGQSLTLLGGTVINTGTIAAPGGNITIAAVPGENLVRISQTGSLLSVELPTEARSTLNSPSHAPLSLPELLTVGNAASATGVTVDNGGVKLTRTNSAISTLPGTTIVDGLISADAIGFGNGGNIYVLGEQTQFLGNITARGGSLGGNGGFVDTSGYRSLLIAPEARVITTAPLGQMGTWLIDPADLTVVAGGGTAAIVGGTNAPVAAATIDAGTIVTGLNGTNINLQATNSITVNAAINSSANAAAGNLSLQAPIANLNQPITLRAGSTLSGTANVVNVGATGGVQNGVDVAASGGTVNLAAAIYTLAQQVTINKNLTLQGAGAANTIVSGNNAVRGFQVNAGQTVTIEALTIANGNAGGEGGGGIRNQGNLTIRNSTIRNNQAAGGGGIQNSTGGNLTILGSTLSNNTASFGGGILNDGGATLTIRNSTLSANQSTGTTVGVDGGGAIDFFNGTGLIENSTIANNTAVIANSSGVWQEGGTLTLRNSIVADNNGTNNFLVTGGTFVSGGYNLTNSAPAQLNQPTDLINTNPLLAPLGNYGGPTQTHALDFNSPAIERGNPTTAPATDQRGFARFGNTDIGAVEYQFKVVNTNNAGVGSLRNAITNANTFVGTDTVIFRIPTTDPGYVAATNSWSIAPTSALPTITQAAIVDATTQPGYATRPVIELNGTNAGAGVNGLTITAGNSTVRGLAINRFFDGIYILTNGNNTIVGNHLGTDVTGTVGLGNRDSGVQIESANNTIGGTTAGAGNLISGNVGGVLITGPLTATGNQIFGNRIGTDITGNTAIANQVGIQLVTPGNTIGGTTAGAGNQISGNSVRGVFLNGANASSTTIQGNLIGTNAAGTTALGNTGEGIRVQNTANTTIGGGTPGAGNLISGNLGNGILVNGAGATGTTIQGNRIGLDSTGTLDLGNGLEGIRVTNAASNTTIGTNADGLNDVGERNIISGNYRAGNVILPDNANIRVDTNANNTRIAGNYIGTNFIGAALPLGQSNGGVRGVQVYEASNTTIGGTTAAERNIISGNIHFGAEIVGTNPGNRIIGNYIGANFLGTSPIANGNGGIQIYFAANTTIGGTNPGEGNLISGNTGRGIAVVGDANTINNTIQGNRIGTNAAGTAALGNGNDGITLFSVGGTTIGGSVAGAGNLISGNTRVGVFVSGTSTTGNTIQGNRIGTNVSGTADLGNLLSGITLNGASNTLIGTNGDGVNDANERNVISGNDRQGNTVTGSNANVQIFNATNTRVAGNYIGTNVAGTALPTGQSTGGVRGIQIRNSTNTTIGGSTTAERNLISGNQHIGIEFVGGGTTGRVIGNYIGTDFTGNSAIANGTGVSTFFANNQTIGGVNPGEGNLISGNTNDGLTFVGNTSTNNIAIGNRIGTNAAGTAALGNGNGVQVLLGANNNRIGTDGDGVNDAAEGNLISGNRSAGIRIQGAGSNNNVIAGNDIGTNATGSAAIPGGTNNNAGGVVIRNGAQNNRIGTDGNGNGFDASERNIISGNRRDGVSIFDANTNNNIVAGNYIGIGADGTTAIDNALSGIALDLSASNNRIGTDSNGIADALERNVISRNSIGIFLGSNSNGNRIVGNYVGTDATGTQNRGNTQDGVYIGNASNNVVTDNLITNNGRGVAIVGATATGNSVLSNSIFGNGAIGIDLGRDGITPNSSPSAANNGQAFPVLISAIGNTVTGLLNSTPSTPYRLEFFSSPTTDQGQTFLGTTNVTTDAAGIANFSAPVAAIPAGVQVSATATNLTIGSTSEFSAIPGITLTATGGTPQTTVVNTPFAAALQGTVLDSRGNPAGGVAVNFVAPVAGATGALTGTVITNLVGQANNSTTANTIAGTYTVTATATGAPAAASFSLTNRPDIPATVTAIGGTPQTATVATAFATALQVNVRDQFGNVVPGATVSFAAPGNGASAVLSSASVITDGLGNASVTVNSNTIAGTYSLSSASGSATPGIFSLTNTPDVPASITPISGAPQTTIVNTAFANPLQVQVVDRFGNPISNSTVTFSVPTTGASGQLSNVTATTNPNGVASVNLSANTIAGSFTSSSSVAGVATSAQFAFTNVPGAPASLTALSSTNQSTTVNTAYLEELRAIVRDSFGNPISNAPVTFTLPSTGASGRFPTGTTITLLSDGAGIVALPLSANTIAGTYRATGTVNGISLSFSLTNNPGAPAFINTLGGDGQTALVTRAFRRSLQVQVTDAFGNLLSGIPLTFSPPSTGASGQFSGSSIVTTNPNGAATAPEFTANAIAGRYTIAVSTTGLTVTPFRLNNSPVPDENRILTDLEGKPLRQGEPRPLNLLPILCVERRLPRTAINEYRDLPNCPQRLPVDEETRRSAPVLRKTD